MRNGLFVLFNEGCLTDNLCGITSNMLILYVFLWICIHSKLGSSLLFYTKVLLTFVGKLISEL